MRGAPTKAIKAAEIDGAMHDGGAHQIILAARRALVDAIECYPVPKLGPRVLRAIVVSGLFADVVCNLAHSPAAPSLRRG
jgi:hypothetical protein